MRIGQLARRLAVTPTEILAFLGTQNIETEAGTNSRLSTDVLTKVITHFAPGKLAEILQAPAEEQPVPSTAQSILPATETTEEVADETVEQPEVPVAEESQSQQPTQDLPVEVIRVSKVELQGLKVLGKIDLPQPKKKEVGPESQQQEESSVESQQTQPVQQTRREFKRRNDRYDRPDRRDREWKNPIELKREQEARKAEEKKKENAERQKEKRTNHYYSKVKSVPTKPVRRYEEQTVEDIETKEPPKGIFGRFLYWLKH